MDLKSYDKLVVKQKVELIEAFTTIETKNKYKISSIKGEDLLFAYENSNFLARILLKSLRPLSINIVNNNDEKFIKIEKDFAFLFPEFRVLDFENRLLAKIKTRFGINSKLEVYNKNQLIFYVKNKIIHPWRFNIYKNKIEENPLGLISKKWGGIARETFTDSDNFLIDFDQIKDVNNKKIILALSLIIDLFVFEK